VFPSRYVNVTGFFFSGPPTRECVKQRGRNAQSTILEVYASTLSMNGSRTHASRLSVELWVGCNSTDRASNGTAFHVSDSVPHARTPPNNFLPPLHRGRSTVLKSDISPLTPWSFMDLSVLLTPHLIEHSFRLEQEMLEQERLEQERLEQEKRDERCFPRLEFLP
jgi:hypothetical protein